MMGNEFFFLSGLPRTGSTVLGAILTQNPAIYSGPKSPVCQLMWDLEQSCRGKARDQLIASFREDFQREFVGQVIHQFYRPVPHPVIVDKSKSWTQPENLRLIKEYIRPDPKIIVMTRPLEDIFDSFVNIYAKSGRVLDRNEMLIPGSEPVMFANEGVEWARAHNDGEFLFIDYDVFMAEPAATLARIYEFCGWEPFNHNFENIVCLYPENDEEYGVDGLHEVRSVLGHRLNNNKYYSI